jgi:predicted lipoprotein with Yx(FWY)xxD motif
MPDSARAVHAETHNPQRGPLARLAVAAIAVVALGTIAATALAAGSALTLDSASSSKLGRPVVVSPQGRTLYRLSPETSRHLLCKSRACLASWPPLTVASAKTRLRAGAGVRGKLGIVRRGNGSLQVTLSGLPLYRFAGDGARGQANGEGIESFGGVWHAVTASSR